MIAETLQDNAHIAALTSHLGEAVLDAADPFGEITISIAPEKIVEACRVLKSRGFNRISAVTAVDWQTREPRFEVIYHLHALPLSPQGGKHERLRLKAGVGGAFPEIDSATAVWAGADWYEREVFDMYGIVFRNHPNLTRILMPDNWEGYPLRKDFPIHGYKYSYAEEK